VPPLALLSAMGVLWGIAFHPVDLVLFVALYVLCAFGTTIGFHRYFTHRSFEARQSVKIALGILGCMTMQGPITQWVTDHRKHHAHTDREGDPHSPHVGHGSGLTGLWHAHVGWLLETQGQADWKRYAPDLYEDPGMRAIGRRFELLALVSLLIPTVAMPAAHRSGWKARAARVM